MKKSIMCFVCFFKFALMLACGMLFASAAVAQDSKSIYGEAQKAYNDYFLKTQQGALDDQSAQSLTTSYDLFVQALACDTVFETNKDGSPKLDKKTGKPKFKTKVSGDVVKAFEMMIAQNDFLVAGEYFRAKEDYHNAAMAYGRNAALLQSKYAKNVPDSVLSESLFLQGFANYFDKDYKNCFVNMVKAKELGYTANSIDQFIDDAPNQIIQKYVNESDFAGANAALDKMLKAAPSNANLYTLRARIIEFEKGFEAAIPAYKIAIEKDPNSAFTNYCIGVGYTELVNKAIMDSKAITDAALAKEIAHLLPNPIKYLSKAVELNNNIPPETLEDAKKKLDILNGLKFAGQDRLSQTEGKKKSKTKEKGEVSNYMKAPTIRPNKYGFITKYDMPKKNEHVKTVLTMKNDVYTAKVYHDDKLVQTFNGLESAGNIDVYYLDANFDGYLDILIGGVEISCPSYLYLWNPQTKRFNKVDDEIMAGLLIDPQEKNIILMVSTTYCWTSYSRHSIVGNKMKEIDNLTEISDPKEYKSYNVKNKYTVIKGEKYGKNGRLISKGTVTHSTNSKTQLPNQWQKILKGFYDLYHNH